MLVATPRSESPSNAWHALTSSAVLAALHASGSGRPEPLSSTAVQGYLHRGDFSRWIADVFGDRALAADSHEQERRYMSGSDLDTIPEIVNAIRGRYDLTSDDEEEPHADPAGVRAA